MSDRPIKIQLPGGEHECHGIPARVFISVAQTQNIDETNARWMQMLRMLSSDDTVVQMVAGR